MKGAGLANEGLGALEALEDLALIQKGAAAAKAEYPQQIGVLKRVERASPIGC